MACDTSILVSEQQATNRLKGETFPQLHLEFFFGCFWKSRTNWQTSAIFMCLHVFLSSTQFSSDQIQNDGVNSDGRSPFLPCVCATMCQWNLPWCEEFCLLWRTSARHKDFIHWICWNILTFYEESNSPRSIYQISNMAPRLSGQNCKFSKLLFSQFPKEKFVLKATGSC